MTSHQRKITVTEEYASSLGFAVYAFTYLEWAAIYVADTLKPGYIRNDFQTGQGNKRTDQAISRADRGRLGLEWDRRKVPR